MDDALNTANGLEWAHPLVRDWFVERFATPTEPQAMGWPHILAGRSTLISAPTGSGKTLAAFLACIDRLVEQGVKGTLEDRTEVLYVSPLKALGNDIQKNLDGPLAEIVRLGRERGVELPEIRTAVRTGDTLMPARQAMLRRPPHILVTTPESLYILLTAEKSRAILKTVRTVIVDEIHAVADDKRGSHLALSLERLDALADGPVTRIGLSATQKPIELVAQFLAGAGRPDPVVVQVTPRRVLDLHIEVPPSELGPVATHELWGEVADRIAALVQQHRSTLVFVNTRRLSERLAHQLSERLGESVIAAHHGSLSRKTRLDAEARLKAGELRALVATASLELGIDIGTIDLVCQIGSPRSISAAVQRIGRAGHWRGAIPKGRLFVTTRDELVECAALVLAIRRGDLDTLVIPDQPLDVLAQQIVAMCAADDWAEDDLFAVLRRAYPYRDLSRDTFDEILEMLAQGIAARRGRYGAYLFRDRVNGRVRGRRGARLVAITNGGAIPDTGLYTVVAEPEGTTVGTVDEDFAVESLAGDVMLLGNTSWRIRRVSIAGRVLVEDAHGASPTIPFWRGEAPARTPELSRHVAEVRDTVSTLARDLTPGGAGANAPAAAAAIDWLIAECALDRAGAEQLADYIVTGRAVLGTVPTGTTIIAERFFDEGGGMQLVIHSLLGARINKAWGLALRKRFCRSFNFELQAAATDNGINIALAEQHSFPLADVFQYLRPATAREVLEQAALASPIFGTRWRWDASRALALQRFRNGKKVPIHLQRLQSDDVLASVFPDVAACQENVEGDIQIPNHPLIREVMKDVLTEAMDVDGLLALLERIDRGEINCVAVDTPVPSVFSHEILNANPYAYLDDAPLEERRARAVEMRRTLPETVLSEVGKLDPAAIAQVCEDAWPEVRDADDLHDALQTLAVFPESFSARPVETWHPWLHALANDRRAGRIEAGGRTYWMVAERARTAALLFPSARVLDAVPDVDTTPAASRTDALVALVQGWLTHVGPTTIAELAGWLGLEAADIEEAMLRIEATGAVLRGRFKAAPAKLEVRSTKFEVEEWCERRLLARIHRLTLGALRREIAPVTSAEFMRWLLAWQHVAPGTQLPGERGTLEVLSQMQGFEAPANAWERQLLARRVVDYNPEDVDRLCLTGLVGWGRLSPHPATLEPTPHAGRRVVPTSVAPIAFFVRDDAAWMAPRRRTDDEASAAGLSHAARETLSLLHRSGASFFSDIVRGTGRLKAEVETALWELVAAGLVTADGFDNLRALIDPKRRAGHGSAKGTRPRHSTGRWSLLHTAASGDHSATVEATCWMLLRRYGVVFRDLLVRESVLPTWRELLMMFRRLEDRGEVRGGRFVAGFIGEQFALPVAVESLRAARHAPLRGETVAISAADPLNLVGILLPGERVPAISGRFVVLRDGVVLEPDVPLLGNTLPTKSKALALSHATM
ncbi:MAG TPA: DEAD/DEAH box helicase [Vicinamibacterales bacterium]|nr:DEAD/DEAH box helicase [Vicinamibacterales bacterium]